MQAVCCGCQNSLLSIVDVLLGQFGSVKPVAPAQVLPDEGDGHGCLIWVQLRHVEIIHKVDELFCTWRPVVDASLHKHQHFITLLALLGSEAMQVTKLQTCSQQMARVNVVGSVAWLY